MKRKLRSSLLLICLDGGIAFQVTSRATFNPRRCIPGNPSRVPTTRRYNFLDDMVGKAFSNDRNLSPDKTEGQYDKPGEEFEDTSDDQRVALTETQKKWRQTQQSGTDVRRGVTPELLTGTSWTLDIFLSGVPARDPSNDLYGSKVNISSRDRDTGLNIPSAPSTSLTIKFLENGVCSSSESDFTSGNVDGEWKLSEDGKVMRFSLDTLGYTRTVETKGSIQNIYWTDEDEKSVQTSTSYSIPPGFVYGDVEVISGNKPGAFELGSDGVLRLEKSTGLFGISSKMVACGKFQPRKN
jgi:hypothetical protein